MRILTFLGGYFYDIRGARHQLPAVTKPGDSVIKAAIDEVAAAGSGVVVLRNEQALESGPEKLEVYIEAGNFLLMLGVNDEDGDYSVRVLANDCMPNDLMVINGEKFPAKAVTRDINRVYAAFIEFVQSGDVTFMR